jgi:4-aminobutyrate aminotransferase-like enzyme
VGCLLGLEFGTADACARFARRALAGGLILGWTLHRDTVVRLAPPLVLTDQEAERGVGVVAAALG